ncbi:hypothetical protein BO85DRAFT_205190 [Aspergillus piperis CBS 112811]|uniref:Secreted protein n=1 Tax=Aspergillus piperis CBS 112811 TaxID=1448313 RepID=A0A8G1VGM1_9EURO|nr:hypothetical protein BO85DRAFT_205190 [Aspergillus piperis CBS 112811]RAH52414.1 hypothetical protein BO85DRAFT_205190 [Aspergillus piperis CBS 112811]
MLMFISSIIFLFFIFHTSLISPLARPPPFSRFLDAHVYMNRKTNCECAMQILESDEILYRTSFPLNYYSSHINVSLFCYIFSKASLV